MNAINDVDDVIGIFPSKSAMARELGTNPSHIAMMSKRNSINVKYWGRIKRYANRNGIELSYDSLVDFHTPKALR